MDKFLTREIARFLRAGAGLALLAVPALAADGYELIGFGVRQRGLGGAGVADSRDAMSMAINPAGAAALPGQLQFGITAITMDRGYTAEGFPFVIAPGHYRSGWPIIPAMNSAYLERIDAESTWGFVSYGHGGANTSYNATVLRPPFGGPFGGGAAGVDYQQQFFSAVYSRQFGPLSIGIAPTLALQFINIKGLQLLAPLSATPSAFTDRGYDWSVGGGVRVGLQYSLTPQLRIGASGSTPIFMSSFAKYAGQIGDQGTLDIPGHVSAGVAYDVTPDLTVMADYKHIFYGSVASLANSSFPIMPLGPGSSGGPGFGLRDTDTVAVGAEWRVNPAITLRLGYNYSSQLYSSLEVTRNVYSPGVSRHHVSGGANFKVSETDSIDVAVLHAFKNGVSGPEAVPFSVVGGAPIPPFINYGARITNWFESTEVSLGYNHKFDASSPSLFSRIF